MASITAREASIVFPLVGSDRRFARGETNKSVVGGQILKGPNAGIVAIHKFSIDLVDGDRLGIFGHNGSGKTTLLRTLAGIYPPSEGIIDIRGSTAGMYSLTLGVNQEATGLQNIQFKGLMRGMSPPEIEEMVARAAEFSELNDYLHLPVKTYSSGMIMRLMFATASVLRPDILLLDEWVSVGDNSFRKKADKLLEGMLERTKIVIIASQNEKRLNEWSNKLVALKAGRVVDPPKPIKLPFKSDPELLQCYRRYINQLDFEAAEQILPNIWPRSRMPAVHYHQVATLALKTRKFDEAKAAFAMALEHDPDNANLHAQLGSLLFGLKLLEETVFHIERALILSDGIVGNVRILQQAKKLLAEQTLDNAILKGINSRKW